MTDSEGDTSTDSDTVSVAAANSAPERRLQLQPAASEPEPGRDLRRAPARATTARSSPPRYAWDLDGDGQFDDALGHHAHVLVRVGLEDGVRSGSPTCSACPTRSPTP